MTAARHVERRHTITVAGPIERIFPLFTPKGEIAWAPGWAPEWLHPADGEICEGMVFRTHHDGETTLWGCVAWRPEAHHVRYARVTPASRFGFVDVACRPLSPDMTEVTVGYDYTALSEAGDASLAGLDEAAFAAMIEGWRDEIAAMSASGGGEGRSEGR
jgi:hypothetical protein